MILINRSPEHSHYFSKPACVLLSKLSYTVLSFFVFLIIIVVVVVVVIIVVVVDVVVVVVVVVIRNAFLKRRITL